MLRTHLPDGLPRGPGVVVVERQVVHVALNHLGHLVVVLGPRHRVLKGTRGLGGHGRAMSHHNLITLFKILVLKSYGKVLILCINTCEEQTYHQFTAPAGSTADLELS